MTHSRLAVLTTILDEGVVPLYCPRDLSTAVDIAHAILKSGGHILEFTMRSPEARQTFAELAQVIRREGLDLVLGAGTVEDEATAATLIADGADFVVSPSGRKRIAHECNRRKVAYIPGCFTLSEIMRAESWGCEIVKLFPADTTFGPAFIRAVMAARPRTRILPTGGIALHKAIFDRWIGAGAAGLGLGSQLFKQSEATKDWSLLTRSLADALAWVHAARPIQDRKPS